MAEFYVEITPQDNGLHVVHNADCSALPGKEAIYYLGSISNFTSALKKASERFIKVNGCSHCAAAYHI